MAKKKKSTKKKKSKSGKKDKNKKQEKEEVCETFEIEKKKNGKKEQLKTVCGSMKKKQASKKEMKRYNTILKWFLIILGAVLVLFFVMMFVIDSAKYFDYRGLTGEMVQEGDLFFYKVSFPVRYGLKKVPYNIYLRNNPEKLGEEIPFNFDYEQEKNEIDLGRKFSDGMYRLILNASDEEAFECVGEKKGDVVISIANMVNLRAMGISVMADANATCDYEGDGRYMYVNIRPAKESETTQINQIGPACYEIIADECEVLKSTERFMVEALVKHAEKVEPLE
ncbi:hypothetical protein GF378_00265 [Candidatus Pacearchaeota archaeon]|nr:hypothetical protein [Candidatus Pacearchaeota archaeon]